MKGLWFLRNLSLFRLIFFLVYMYLYSMKDSGGGGGGAKPFNQRTFFAGANLRTAVYQANVFFLLLHIYVKMGDDCTLFLLPTNVEPKSTRPLYTLPPTVQGMGKLHQLFYNRSFCNIMTSTRPFSY